MMRHSDKRHEKLLRYIYDLTLTREKAHTDTRKGVYIFRIYGRGTQWLHVTMTFNRNSSHANNDKTRESCYWTWNNIRCCLRGSEKRALNAGLVGAGAPAVAPAGSGMKVNDGAAAAAAEFARLAAKRSWSRFGVCCHHAPPAPNVMWSVN